MASIMPTAQDVDSKVTWSQAKSLAERIKARHPNTDCVYGIPRGGIAVAGFVDLPMFDLPLHNPTPLMIAEHAAAQGRNVLIVDDIVDSGKTAEQYMGLGFEFDSLFRKPHSPAMLAPEAIETTNWIEFPWEVNETGPEDAVRRLLEYVGEDPTREGLLDTPKRVVKAFREMTEGLLIDPRSCLGTVFNETSDEMVVVRGIRFSSMCEHHLLPFTGTAAVGYVPDNKVVGLSKIPRLVEAYAKRPQVQERMTNQISNTLIEVLKPLGVGVVVKAHHSCMGCRGVRQPDAEMITSSMLGCMREDPSSREELLRFI
jgi:GTP cyclohydrolase IA